jgi:hypothetical protein
MQFSARLFASEIPADGGAIAVNAAAPGMDFATQCNQAGNPALPVLGIQQRLLPGARRVGEAGSAPLGTQSGGSTVVPAVSRITFRAKYSARDRTSLRSAIYGVTAPTTGGFEVAVPK